MSHALAQLQDRLPPFPAAVARRLVASQSGRPLERLPQNAAADCRRAGRVGDHRPVRLSPGGAGARVAPHRSQQLPGRTDLQRDPFRIRGAGAGHRARHHRGDGAAGRAAR